MSTATAPGLVVRPIRFTDDLPGMTGFLELLGLRPRVASDRGGWVDLSAGGGLVALHAAAGSSTDGRPGETRLSFEVDDADALADRLRSAGFTDATVYDESFGRVLTVTDPLGAPVWVDERSTDLYGYRLLDGRPAPGAPRVVPVRFTDEAAGYDGFLRALGLNGTPEPGGYATYGSGPAAAPGADGLVGVHYVYDDELPVLGDRAAVQLTFLTRGDLAEVESRLEARGIAWTRFDEEFGSFLDVTDPDGQSVQVHRESS